MSNSRTGGRRAHSDEWYYERLPLELRDRLAHGPYEWSSCWVLTSYKRYLKRWPHSLAVAKICNELDAADAIERARCAKQLAKDLARVG